MVGVSLLTAPALEPVSLAEAKAHLRLEDNEEDELIAGLIVAARQYCEGFTRRALISQEWRLVLDGLPRGAVGLPRPPLIAVDALRLRDGEGGAEIVDPARYRVDTASEPGRLLVTGMADPPGRELGGVEIDFTAGFGAAASDVPAGIRQAIKLIAAHWFENRELVAAEQRRAVVPVAVAGLLQPWRVVGLA